MNRTVLCLALLAAACGGSSQPTASAAAADSARTLFVQSAVEHPDFTVTLPLHRGTSQGKTVWYVVLDASSDDDARAQGVNRSSKLGNARGSRAVQRASVVNGVLDFPGTVDFAFARRSVVPGPTGFPPAAAQYAAQGDPRYSPLVELPDGTVENAPHVANDTGLAPKVVAIDFAGMTVTMEETPGFQGGKAVRYLSTDASLDVAAALENVTFAPLLNEAPRLDDDSTASSRTSLAAFVNGQTGVANPERQGLNSAILDGQSPLNVLRWNPGQGRYSPLWDVHLAAWSPAAIATGQNLRQRDYGDVVGLASKGLVTAPDGSPFAASGFIVNCPIISSD
jgi:hypothetical protein